MPKRWSALAFAVAIATAVNALAVSPAVSIEASGTARAGASVSLDASPSVVDFGDPIALSGSIDPATKGQTIELRDATGALLDTLSTGSRGRFATTMEPRANANMHATWVEQAVDSATVGLRVRPVLDVALTGVRLFGSALARGTVRPARAGERVTVELLREGHVAAVRRVATGASGGFRARLPIDRIGSYRLRATFDPTDLAPGRAVSRTATTPMPPLAEGSRGAFVRLLERRLVDLDYHLSGVDDLFDQRTSDAMIAFRKVQGMPRTADVTESVWRALVDPKRPHPRSTAKGFHIEVDQRRQVLITVDDGSVRAILHVSTGKPSTPTNDGAFHVYRKLAGYSGNQLYYPSYFDGLRAIHGWPDVPTYAASHGCVRAPMWAAKWIFGLASIGTKVIVHH